MLCDLDAVGGEFAYDDGGEGVLDEPIGDLTAGGDESAGLELPGGEGEEGREA